MPWMMETKNCDVTSFVQARLCKEHHCAMMLAMISIPSCVRLVVYITLFSLTFCCLSPKIITLRIVIATAICSELFCLF